jgi:hypothetical protein
MTDVEKLILGELTLIRSDMADLKKNGCSKGMQHDSYEKNQGELFKRVRSLEDSRAEGKGKLAVAVAVFSTGVTLAVMWIGKRL